MVFSNTDNKFEYIKELNKDINTLLSPSFSSNLDSHDELKSFTSEFNIVKKPPHLEESEKSIYLCGNSLGCMPKRAKKYVEEEMKKWSLAGVEGHFTGERPWVSIDEKCTRLLMPLIGAKKSSEIAIMNTLSLNCHLFLISFFRPTETRYKIMIESQAFCSDHHIVRSQLRLHGLNEDALIQIKPRSKEDYVKTEDILKILDEQGEKIALVFIGGVNFFTGQLFDMKAITSKAHEKGSYAGFDLAHCVGNVPVHLHDWNVDFATWCHYKYVNSGPGCIAGAFLHDKHASRVDLQRLDGWWGQTPTDRFKMFPTHVPKPGAQAYMLSNPSVFSVVCLQASLELFEQAGVENLRFKSRNLTRYLELLLEGCLPEIKILTPKDPNQRGSQLSLQFSIDIKKVHEQLTKEGIICDIRRPNIMRIAPVPLYNNFTDVLNFVKILLKNRSLWKTNTKNID